MNQRVVRIALWTALFVVTFVVGLIVTFPMGLVTRIIEAQAEKALDFRYDVEIERTRLWGIGGVKLVNVSIASTAPLGPGEVRLPTEFDTVRARVRLLSLLGGGTPAVRGDVRIDEGRVQFAYGPGEEEGSTIEVTFDALDLRQLDVIRQVTGMPMQGQVNGTVRLDYNDELRLSGGNIDVSIPGLIAGPGAVKSDRAFAQIGGSLPLPATDLGTLTMRAGIERSTLDIQQLEARGSDIQLDVSGRLELRDPIRASRVALQLLLALDATYVEEAGLGSVIGRIDLLQRAQTSSGYALSLNGVLGNLRPEPAGGRF